MKASELYFSKTMCFMYGVLFCLLVASGLLYALTTTAKATNESKVETNEIHYTFYVNPYFEHIDEFEFSDCKNELGEYTMSLAKFKNNDEPVLVFSKEEYDLFAFEGKFFSTVEMIKEKYDMEGCQAIKYALDHAF